MRDHQTKNRQRSELPDRVQMDGELSRPRIYWRHAIGIGVAVGVIYVLLVAALVFAHG